MIIDFMVGKVITVLFILVCAVIDAKHKNLDIRIFIAAAVSEILWYMYSYIWGYKIEYKMILAGMMIGAIIFVISIISKGCIGEGDALFFGITGLAVGWELNLYLLFLSLLLSAVFSLGIIALGIYHGDNIRKRTIAFIPFTVPAIVWIILEGLIYV